MADDSEQVGGNAWGDSISEARQAELRELFERQKAWVAQPDATRGDSVFKGVQLTGADVYWLAEASGRDEFGGLPNLHLEQATLSSAQLEKADLRRAQLKGAYLVWAHLDGADLRRVQLEGANLYEAQLEGANLFGAQLEEANLGAAQLKRAYLGVAHLEEAILVESHLEEAILEEAQLKRADLRRVQLEGANLFGAHLEGADLTSATFDKTSRLKEAVLTDALFDQVTYDGVNLTGVDWSLVPVLGDELTARQRKGTDGRRKDRTQRLDEFRAAVRANRVLAVTLRSQGMSEDADRYAYRAQVLQRTVLRLQGKRLAAVGSWLLDFISGYGYAPLRSLATYVIVILGFAVAYRLLGNNVTPPLGPLDAVVFSVTSFHGRGFSPGEVVSLHNPLTVLAAMEAVLGLLIEITFIATFTQRFFAR
ncbi:MAG TPA: pentapeptide repeat-containing protein [Ktedonobacterales bacterium]